MKEDKDAIGGNYKYNHLNVFGSVENFYKNAKTYRRVFDASECRYIYGELSFYNKLFDERDWECQSQMICTNVDTQEELCNMKKELQVKATQNIVKVQEGWGTAAKGWWKEGKYKWDAYLNDEYLGTEYFYIVNDGPVTSYSNPYISIQHIRLFESSAEAMPIKDRKYLQTFNKATTRHVHVEVALEIISKTRPLPLYFKFNFENDAGQHKAYMEFFEEIEHDRSTFTFDVGYGLNSGNYWYEDNYTLEVVFMNELIAVVPFAVAQEEQEADGELSFEISNKVEEIRNTLSIVEAQKITFEEATAELNALIGLEAVKKQIDEFATYLKFLKIREEKGFEENNTFNLHTAFLGNPGTGKTTVAKMLGKIYYSLDLLSKGHVHEVGRIDLVGEYVGQTAPKVIKAIEKARGGILFVDEAYALSNKGDNGKDFGREVIEVLLKEMSDGAGDLAVIFAGYPNEMKTFLSSNPGMSSRISNHIYFSDYVPDELMEIAAYASKKRAVTISEAAKKLLYKKIIEVYRTRDHHFGNARYMNGVVEECKQNMALRLMRTKDFDSLANDTLSTIELEDVEKLFGMANNKSVHIPVDEVALDDALKELHEMIGLEGVKQDVDEMAKLVRYYTEIGRDVKTAFSMHTVFTGNPGTGKTTVARILVKIYKALGILERGHLVECDRKELVAGYMGQTAVKTSLVIDEAIGGGLFIDEAYSLTEGRQGDFGREAIETLLKRMEDQRGDFIVIAAGYPNEMNRFMETNPGLMSRFDRTLQFPDYSAKELMDIVHILFEKEKLHLDEEATIYLQQYVEDLLLHKHQYFGNARSMRKIVKEITRRQNLRLAELPAAERTTEMVQTVTLTDFEDFKLSEFQDERKHKGIGFR